MDRDLTPDASHAPTDCAAPELAPKSTLNLISRSGCAAMANMANALLGAFPAGGAHRVISQRQNLPSHRRSHGVNTVCSSVRGGADDVFLLDYGAGNVRSVRNAVKRLGYNLRDVSHRFLKSRTCSLSLVHHTASTFSQVQHVDDISKASRLIFPGVGAYGQAMERLKHLGYVEALRDYIQVAASCIKAV